jgi:hypothetical protein
MFLIDRLITERGRVCRRQCMASSNNENATVPRSPLFRDLLERLRIDMIVVDTNLPRLLNCVKSMIDDKNRWLGVGNAHQPVNEAAQQLDPQEYATALEFYLQIDSMYISF